MPELQGVPEIGHALKEVPHTRKKKKKFKMLKKSKKIKKHKRILKRKKLNNPKEKIHIKLLKI